MARVLTTENPSVDVRRFLRHWAAQSFVEERLREQHPGLGTDRRRTKARQITRLIQQGLEFLKSADQSATSTKPLTLFYGAENLAKAACLTRDVNLDADGIRFHGLGGERETKRYSIKNLAAKVYQPGKDVWSHTFANFNCDRHRYTKSEGFRSSIGEMVDVHSTPPLEPPAQLHFGDLLRHLPDLAEDVELADWGSSYMVRADELGVLVKPGPPLQETLTFKLRHGYRPAIKTMIEGCESNILRQVNRDRERLDIFEYSGNTPVEVPTLRPDVFGQHFMDLFRGRRVIGELPLYFGALFILSDVVRYQAEHWLRLLNDHPAEEIVVERFLDIAGRKFPNLILNELHQEVVEFKLST